MAAIGLYGLVSYSVSQRTHEIGLRMALGARRRHILWLVIHRAIRLVTIGLALGLLGAFALTRFIASLLFGISTHDPAVFPDPNGPTMTRIKALDFRYAEMTGPSGV